MTGLPDLPDALAHRYDAERLLGRGAVGHVLRARDRTTGGVVALKIIPADRFSSAAARQQFARDALILQRLRHPSIIAVLDHGLLPDGAGFYVMEFEPGEDLRTLLQRQGRLAVDRAVTMLTSICAGVEAAHREGLLHRDLKPENILVPAGSAPPKVMDFAVAQLTARSRDDSATSAGAAYVGTRDTIVGTPAYMAPEQLRAADGSVTADVFSLGAIAYEMLSGNLPFGPGSLAQIALAQARGMRPMPAGLVPPPLERAIRTALDPEPDRRPVSAQAFAHLLAAAADT